jgi:hypothetical protein
MAMSVPFAGGLLLQYYPLNQNYESAFKYTVWSFLKSQLGPFNGAINCFATVGGVTLMYIIS